MACSEILRATGWAVLDAVRDAGNRWVFPELLAEDLAPWGGVTQVWAAGSPDARHGVDITATFARGVASLRESAKFRGDPLQQWALRPTLCAWNNTKHTRTSISCASSCEASVRSSGVDS